MTALFAIEPAAVAHFVAVNAALHPGEARLVQQVTRELQPDELRAWIEDLRLLTVPDAVAQIRVLIGTASEVVP